MTLLVSLTAINVPGHLPRMRLRINVIPRFRMPEGRPARFWESVRVAMTHVLGASFRDMAAEAMEVVLGDEEG